MNSRPPDRLPRPVPCTSCREPEVRESREEATDLLRALLDGGEIGMELQETEWAELFGVCTDKYGIKWMINYPGSKAE